ncbi:hypothetical protein C9374_005397 [Naegleria lovaniensis]|uniref:UBX domain-containing protein n=1 Tax=Naegleria lovaniensis TaxID=51637 RepID=A0AA88GL28_NAELO|nr:uncharacterized protein C9374_005397 [Naegleria lovaniensis]KAG2382195.1 hypothetical protein C9374_005397 [Naegleria lovaniensis]
MFSCFLNVFGCCDEVRRTLWKGHVRRSDANAHHELRDSDEEEMHHGLAQHDMIAGRTSMDRTSMQEEHELAHDGMTDEEFAQLLQQQEYEEAARRSRSGSTNVVSSSSGSNGRTMVDLGESSASNVREEQDQAYLRSLQRDQERSRQEELERQRQEQEERERQRQEQEKIRKEQEKIVKRREKATKLKPEPAETESNFSKVLIRLPDSSRLTRSFRHSDTIGDIFDYLDVTKEIDVDKLVLVTTYPARRFSYEEHAGLSLAEANLSEKQVSLNLAEK